MPPPVRRLHAVPDDEAPLRAWIYARTSRDRNKRAKSTESQTEVCREECDARGWRVVNAVADDDRPASAGARKPREAWDLTLAAIRRGDVDVLVTWESSRLTRRLDGWVELAEALDSTGTQLLARGDLIDVSKSSDRARAGHDAVDAERESRQTSERVLRAKSTDAKAGWPHGVTPWGYTRSYDPASGVLEAQIIDPTTGPLVRWMADVILEGGTLAGLARELNTRGEGTPKPPRKPDRTRGWTANTVRQVLKGPAIAGLRVRRTAGEPAIYYPAAWPAIVSRDEWDEIGAILADPSRVTHRGSTPRHLLSHLARCGECLIPVRQKTKDGQWAAYACAACGGVYIAQAPVDALVTSALIAYLTTPETLEMLAHGGDVTAPARLEARALVVVLEGRLSELVALFRDGDLDPAGYAAATKVLAADLTAARATAAITPTHPTVRRLVETSDVAAAWDALDVTDQRAVVRAVFDVRLHRAEHRGGRRFDPRRVEILPLATL